MTKCRIRRGSKSVLALSLAVAGLTVAAQRDAAGQAPVVTTRSTLSTTLSGVAGKVAANKFGDVFQGSTFSKTVYEYPANGAAPVAIFTLNTAYTGTNAAVGTVFVDANQNLYVTSLFVTATSTSDSAIYEFPYVNGTYPAPYTLSGPVAACGANPTTVCAWGNFLSGIDGYYYGPWDFAIDGNGTGYLVTDYDGSKGNGNSGNNIFACTAACEARAANAAPTVLAGNLPNPVLSLNVDAAGDVFYADGSSNAYVIPAGTTAPLAIGGAFNQTIGVALDRAGNLYVTDCNGLYEVAVKNGSYTASVPFEVVPLPGGSTRTSGGGYNGGGVAFDREGNVYAATGFTNLYRFSVDNGGFAAAAVPAGTASLVFNVVFNKTVASATLTTVGAQAGEFQVSGSTCAAGGTGCTFNATFQPAGVGQRRAGLTLTDSAGDTVVTALAGVGQGSAVTVDPGTATKVDSGFQAAAGVAVDTAGNLFVADSAANAVYEYPAGAGPKQAVGAGFASPTGVAVDGGGNLYVADAGGAGSAGRIVEVPLRAGAYSSAEQTTVATGLGALKGLFVDGAGTVYAADSTNKNVFSIPATQFGQGGGATFGTGLTAPSDVAVDASGNLYIADPQANQVVIVNPEGAQSTVGAGLAGPTGVAVDASGSVLVADQGNQRIVRVPDESGSLNPNDQVAVSTVAASPYALRLGANGNLVVSDNGAQALESIDRAQGSVAFAGINVNTTSGAQPVYLSSAGTGGLPLSSPLYTAPAPPFSLSEGTPACPAGASLGAGFSCQLSATFSPTQRGTQSVTASLNVAASGGAAPSVLLAGDGLQLATPVVTLQQTAPQGVPSFGQTVTFSVTVTGSAGTPAGTVTLFVDGSPQPAKPLTGGAASFSLAGLAGGQHILYAQYPGDGALYAAGVSTPSLTVTVAQASSVVTVAVAATAVQPLSAAVGDAITFSSTLTPSVPGFLGGTVNFVAGGVTLATANVVAGAGGGYAASVTTTAVPSGSYTVTAVYSGNANYTASTSSTSVALLVVATSAKLSLTPVSTSLASSGGGAPGTAITVGSLAGFQGGVVFNCSGLPANATCNFNPAIVTLQAGSGAPLSVPPQTVTLTVSVNQAPLVTPTSVSLWGALPILLLLLRSGAAGRSRRITLGGLTALCLLIAAGLGLGGCGNGSPATPKGSYPLKVTAVGTPSVPATPPTSGANNSTVSFTLNLTVQ